MSEQIEQPAAPAATPEIVAPTAPAAAPVVVAPPVVAAPAAPDESGFRSFLRRLLGVEQAAPSDLPAQIKLAYAGEELSLAETLATEHGADSLKSVQLALELRKQTDRLNSTEAANAQAAAAFDTERASLNEKITSLTTAGETAAAEIAKLKAELDSAAKAKADAEKAFADIKGSGHAGPVKTGLGGGVQQVNPWMGPKPNLTQQARISRENPDLAAAFKSAAGVR